MTYNKKKLAVTIAMLAGVTMGLTGCDNNSSSSSAPASAAADANKTDKATPAKVDPNAKTKNGDVLAATQTLVRGNGDEPASLDPHKVEGVPEANIIRDLQEGIVSLDGNGQVIPGVAESWENEGFKRWVFHLRKDAKWSNGQPVTADDFVFSWRRLVDPKTGSPYASYLEYAQIENVSDVINGKKPPETLGVKALDPYTLEVVLSKPVPYFVKMLSHTSAKPVNKAVVEQFGDKWTTPANYVSNGAYKLKDWVVNERIVLERNPQYWDNANVTIDQVTFLPINEQTDVNRYRAGEVDMTYNTLPIEMFKKLQADIPQEVRIDPYLCSYYYGVNTAKAPFNDVRVRKALSLGVDRDVIAKQVMGQGQIPAYMFTPEITNGFDGKNPEWANWTQEQRNQEAAKLLTEAGFDKSKPLTFTLLYNTSENHKKVAVAITSMWKKNLGVDVALENQEWKTFLDNRRLGNYDVTRAGWCADYNDPTAFLNILLSKSSNNDMKYKSAEFDSTMVKTLEAATDAERAALYQAAEAIADTDAPLIPLYHYVSTRLVKPYVGGYSSNNPQDEIYSKDLYIKQH